MIWINRDTKEVKVWLKEDGIPGPPSWPWSDPIGAAYTQWREMSNSQRMQLMEETAIDLAMQGFDLKDVLIAFANVVEFKALGSKSFPMCRALTSALVGVALEPNTMTYEELLESYAR